MQSFKLQTLNSNQKCTKFWFEHSTMQTDMYRLMLRAWMALVFTYCQTTLCWLSALIPSIHVSTGDKSPRSRKSCALCPRTAHVFPECSTMPRHTDECGGKWKFNKTFNSAGLQVHICTVWELVTWNLRICMCVPTMWSKKLSRFMPRTLPSSLTALPVPTLL